MEEEYGFKKKLPSYVMALTSSVTSARPPSLRAPWLGPRPSLQAPAVWYHLPMGTVPMMPSLASTPTASGRTAPLCLHLQPPTLTGTEPHA